MLYIFDSTEQLLDTMPINNLSSAVHRDVLNGENTFTFTFPVGNEYITEGNLVAFRDLDSYWQIFEIKRFLDIHTDGLTRTAYCEHIFYELLDDFVEDKRPSADATAALAGMLEHTRWQIGIVDDLGISNTNAYYISALEAVNNVANAWKGELNWRCVIEGGIITRYVDLKAMVGTDTGKQFTYTKDILSIEREEDISGIATALYGRGKGIETESGGFGRRLTFADIVAGDKPLGQEWVGDTEALAQWGRNGRHRFGVFIDEDETDAEKLLEKTRAELVKRKVPRVTYRLDVVSLERLSGYEHEKVRKGDLVRVLDRKFKPELLVSARIIDIERDLVNPKNTRAVLGSFAPTIIETTINTNRIVEQMANRPYNTKWLDGAINILQNAIENSQAYIWETPQGTLHMNAPTYEQATEAMLLGGGRIAFANQKDGQGGWNWRTFGTGAGYTADEMNAGRIRAEFIQIGGPSSFAEGYDPSEKKRIFRTQPIPPYDTGDLWVEGATGHLRVCKSAKTTGQSYVLTDWELATKYTDNSALETFVASKYAEDLADLQNQIDGSITTWFYDYAPTLSNAPAVNWTTDTVKDEHIGDLFYDTNVSSGHGYRFAKVSGAYQWIQISDSDVTAALANAAAAQDTADKKRRVFTAQPYGPYDVGDLWAAGSTGDLKRCKTATSTTNYFNAADWELASKYTDDTIANSKIKTYYQDEAPSTGLVAGDLWVDTNDNNQLYRWSGTAWISARDQAMITAGMGVDANCTALFHFDGSLKSHKGLDATFTRASPAYLSDGTLVESGVPRFEEGRFGKGIMVEEGTTNLLSNPSFEMGDFSGWFSSFQDGLAYWKINPDEGFCGQRSIVLTGNGTHRWCGIGSIVENPAIGETYSFSGYFKCDSGITYGGSIRILKSTDNGITWAYVASSAVVRSTYWQRIEMQYAVEEGVNAIALEVISSTGNTDGKNVYADGFQLEAKPYPTSFVDGTRAAETLTIPASMLDFSKGTISLWFKPSEAFWNGSYNRIIGHATAMNTNELTIARNGTGSSLICYASDASVQWSGGTYSALQSQTSLVADTWYNLVFTWENGGKLTLYVNGVKEGQINYDKIPSVFGTLAVGYHPNISDRYANGIIDDLRIDNVCRTDDEIRSWYNAQAPFYAVEELTTFVNGVYAADKYSLQSQIDGKIETWFQATDPNTWPEADRIKHTGDMWYSSSTKLLKRYDGANNTWTTIEDQKAIDAYAAAGNAQTTANSRITTFYGTTTPTALAAGDLWIHSGNGNKLYRAAAAGANEIKTGEWELVRDSGIEAALAAAAGAQETADGKIMTYYQTTMPTTGSVGDLWFDTDDNKKLYRHNGTTFVATDDSRIAQAVTAAAGAQATADGKVTTFYQNDPPTAEGIGDLWIDTNDGNKLYRWNGASWISVQDEAVFKVNMGVDADCVGLWHFDGSLNSHKGVSAIGDENFDTGCFGQAVMVEAQNTNLLTENQSSIETDTTGFEAIINGIISKDTTEHYQGSASLRVQGSARYDGVKLSTASAVTAGKYTFSVYLKGSGEVRIRISNNGTASKFFSLTSTWKRYSVTKDCSSAVIDMLIQQINSSPMDIYCDGLQLEASLSPTTWQLGGASRSGTGIIKIPTTDMSVNEGAISFRAKNLSESGKGAVLIDLPDNAGNQGMLCGIASDGKLFIEDAKLQFQSVETSQADFNTGTLIDVTATAEGNLELARDGTDFSYEETSQADFNTGTLTNVTATSVGDLELEYTPGETTYGTDFTGNGTYSADSELNTTYPASNVFDNNTDTLWLSADTNYPHWVKVDLGSGVTKTARKLRINKQNINQLRTFKLQGSNNNTDWTDIYTNEASQTTGWFEYTFDNPTAYRYYRIYGTDSYSGYLVMQIAEAELMEGTETQGTYTTSGTREIIVDLSGAVSSGGTNIEWSKTTPANTAVKVETALSTDGGTTYGAYQEATSGSSIPGISAGTNLSNAKLKIKETLSTTDTSVTPQLHSLNFDIYASYKSSGYRYKVYDISAVGSVGSSKITWTENNLSNTTLIVKVALSTDGGSTYGSFQTCANGSAIPGLTQGMDILNARLKVQEDLATSDGTKTPQLQSLIIDVGSNVQAVYGPNKSTLTAWDSISLAWKSDRLSLVVNETEYAIENPGLPSALGSYLHIGTDRNGNNAINTLVDELRIDKVYKEVAIRTAWHKVGSPFYTSEDMKQWPGYMQGESDGVAIYDSEGSLRVKLGSWLEDLLREYGLMIIGGKIYSSLIRTGLPGNAQYIAFEPPNRLVMYAPQTIGSSTPVKILEMASPATADKAGIDFYNANGTRYGQLLGQCIDTSINLSSLYGKINLFGKTGVVCSGNFAVTGNLSCTGSKPAQQATENYGLRYMYATEAPELVYYDRGVVNLINGETTVKLDPIYLECIEPDSDFTPWQIWVQACGENDVYVSEVGANYFKVKEKNNGTSNSKVVWKHEAIRKGYAGIRLMEVVD